MAVKRGVVVVTTGFLMGALFLGLPTFSSVLFESSTPAANERLERYFARWWEAPVAVKALLHADMVLGLIALCLKFAEWSDVAFYFDGMSILAFVVCVSLYVGVLVPGLRDLNPHSSMSGRSFFTSLYYRVDRGTTKTFTEDVPMNRQEHIAVLAASCVIALAALILVLILQAGEWYSIEQVRKLEEEVWRKEQEELKTSKQE